MKPYVHHIPGRLRVRSSRLNCADPKTGALLDALRALTGVVDVTCNQHARSITVRYDTDQVNHKEVYACFAESGCLVGTENRSGALLNSPKLGTIVNKLLWLALEKSLQRSVVSLVSAVR